MHTYKDMTAETLYESLREDRQSFLDRAEECAAFTIPAIFPYRNKTRNSDYLDPIDGTGARCVNHLSSRLLLTLLPTSAQFARMIIDKEAKSIIVEYGNEIEPGQGEAMLHEVESQLAEIERMIQATVEVDGLRIPTSEIFKQLIVTGNALMYMDPEGGMDYWTLKDYVVLKDLSSNLLAIVIKESVSPDILDEDIDYPNKGEDTDAASGGGSNTKTVNVFTKIWLSKSGVFSVRQEINGAIIENTEGTYSEEALPYMPLSWSKVKGENYGRSLCSEYMGSLRTIEALSKGLKQAGLAAARIVPLVRPGAQSTPEDFNNSQNGEFVFGEEGDISFANLNKFADLSIVQSILDRQISIVEAAFLLNASAIRDAERVTAEEVRLVAQEIETALGGVYSILSREFQLPVVEGILRRLQKSNQIPKFDAKLKKHIKPTMVTGAEALGRSQDLDRFMLGTQALQGVVGPEQLAQEVNLGALINFAYTSAGINIDGIIKTDEQKRQEEQKLAVLRQQQQQEAMLAETMKAGLKDPEAVNRAMNMAGGGIPGSPAEGETA